MTRARGPIALQYGAGTVKFKNVGLRTLWSGDAGRLHDRRLGTPLRGGGAGRGLPVNHTVIAGAIKVSF